MKLSTQLQQQLNNLKAEADKLMNKEGVKAEEINAKADEIKAVKAKLEYQLQVEADEEAERQNQMNNGSAKPIDGKDGEIENKVLNIFNKKQEGIKLDNQEEKEYRNVFNKVLRNKNLTEVENEAYSKFMNAYSSNTTSNGAALIPLDEDVMIHEFKRAVFDIQPYIDIEFTNTLKGTRVYETLADLTELENLDEYNDIHEDKTEQFSVVSYTIHDYAGFIKIPNSLLADEKADLVGYIYRRLAKRILYHMFRKVFFGKGSVNNDCQGLITHFNTNKKVEVLDAAITLKKLKTVVEVDLDPAISDIATLFMNQDVWNYISGLDEANKNKLYIERDLTQPLIKRFLGRNIVVLPNKWMPTDATDSKGYLVIGNLYEAVVAYIRQAIEIESTRTGGEAWRKNLTEYRYILRMDTKLKDLDAVKIIKTPIV